MRMLCCFQAWSRAHTQYTQKLNSASAWPAPHELSLPSWRNLTKTEYENCMEETSQQMQQCDQFLHQVDQVFPDPFLPVADRTLLNSGGEDAVLRLWLALRNLTSKKNAKSCNPGKCQWLHNSWLFETRAMQCRSPRQLQRQ